MGLAALAMGGQVDLRSLTGEDGHEKYRVLAKTMGGFDVLRMRESLMVVRERSVRDAESLLHVLAVQENTLSPLLSGAL